ncbi:hypothetical protein CHS0354_042913 [Potamilus streckersoni]|uniref:Sequestosome-1 UBA domain-containing protein n=1 Tax=Potamilus streckersoni TaxID=2493646 RepID=A0AAE0W828_9BIVA|nr:hypothetical protein CHS0354_042913 [Potamilus streckersoni]
MCQKEARNKKDDKTENSGFCVDGEREKDMEGEDFLTTVDSNRTRILNQVKQIMERHCRPTEENLRHDQILMKRRPLILKKVKTKITKALQQMLAMFFNNDGGWLTSPLVSVDWNIGRALDAMKPQSLDTRMA